MILFKVAFLEIAYNISFMNKLIRLTLRLAKIVFAFGLFYFAIRISLYHFHLTTFPYPVSLREGAMMTSTDALIKGINPYDMSLQPFFMNQYGIIYPLLVWPLAKIFGTTMLVHRIITALSILGSCAVVWWTLKKLLVPLPLSLWSVLMLYSSLIYPGTSTPTIDPGATGMLFLLLSILIPWHCKYSYRSLFISIRFGLLAFYTKLYTFFGALIMCSYLFFFISKLKGFIYGILLLTLSTISIILVNQFFPAYFDNCFFSHANMEHAWASMERLHLQIFVYSGLHEWTLILIGFYILWQAIKSIRQHSWNNIMNNTLSLFLKLNFSNMNEPLIRLNFPLILYAGLCASFLLYTSLGRHSGAMLWYFFQLLSPFLLMGAAWLFSRQSFWAILCVPFLLYNLWVMTSGEDYTHFNKKMANWPEIINVISQHQHILNSSLIAPILIEQNKDVIDDGQAEYFGSGSARTSWMKYFFQEDRRVDLQLYLYFKTIRWMVQNKKFDLIILQPSLLPMGVADDIREYYKYYGSVNVEAAQDQRPYALSVWIPI